jgi:hypothetical protein
MRISRIPVPLVWRSGLAFFASVLLLHEVLTSPSSLVYGEDIGQRPNDHPLHIASPAVEQAIYPAITAHPLFDPSRTPWAPPARKLAAQAPPMLPTALLPPRGYLLLGLVNAPHQRSALLRDPFGKTVFLTEGQLLANWTVGRIDGRGVHLRADGAHVDLTFPSARDTGSPANRPSY